MGQAFCCLQVEQATVGIVEQCGSFSHVSQPGCHFLPWICGTNLAGVLSVRIQQLDVRCETKTKDNVFVNVVASIQYRVIRENAVDAFYKLTSPREQIQAYVFDVVRSSVPKMNLDAVFESKNDVAKIVEEELEKAMTTYGYEIVQTLIVDIEPDQTVKRAMNEINAEKVLQVKKAEAEAESKYLAGLGIARQRQAIVDGLRESVLAFSGNVPGTAPKDVMEMVLMTQYFDTMKDIGTSSRNSTIFLPHGPATVAEIANQVRYGLTPPPPMKFERASCVTLSQVAKKLLLLACCVLRVEQSTVGFVERFGRYSHVAQPGCHCLCWPCGITLAGLLSMRIQQLDVRCETKTKDNVFVNVVASVQYRVIRENEVDAYYKLTSPKEQIQAYVFDVVRASVPKMNLDSVFESKNDIAKVVEDELEKAMATYGYEIVQTLIVDIEPDQTVKRAMNEINAAVRLRAAATEKGEAEKVLQVKRAEAEAEAKYLSGLGIARQRQAIVDGLRESVLAFSGNVPGTGPKDVMEMVLMTQYFDTMKEIGSHSKNSTLFLPHGPANVAEIANQCSNALSEQADCRQPLDMTVHYVVQWMQ
eukprot:SM000026S09014  [mRNA]  locus=s26:938118:943961:- [translate_table: standard]